MIGQRGDRDLVCLHDRVCQQLIAHPRYLCVGVVARSRLERDPQVLAGPDRFDVCVTERAQPVPNCQPLGVIDSSFERDEDLGQIRP